LEFGCCTRPCTKTDGVQQMCSLSWRVELVPWLSCVLRKPLLGSAGESRTVCIREGRATESCSQCSAPTSLTEKRRPVRHATTTTTTAMLVRTIETRRTAMLVRAIGTRTTAMLVRAIETRTTAMLVRASETRRTAMLVRASETRTTAMLVRASETRRRTTTAARGVKVVRKIRPPSEAMVSGVGVVASLILPSATPAGVPSSHWSVPTWMWAERTGVFGSKRSFAEPHRGRCPPRAAKKVSRRSVRCDSRCRNYSAALGAHLLHRAR
jgi:hypothetical protein